MKLSDDLQYWRAERPDEWTMDRFIRKANKMENLLTKINGVIIESENEVECADALAHEISEVLEV